MPWLAGTLAVHQLPRLPGPEWVAPAFLAGLLLLKPTRLQFLFWAIAGFAWTSYCAQVRLADRLPAATLGRDFELTGWIDGFPSPSPGQVTFSFTVSAPRPAGVPPADSPHVVRPAAAASSRNFARARGAPEAATRAAQSGRLRLRAVAPHGGYGATGYVRSARIEEGAPSFRRSWLLLRARLADRYAAAAPDASAAALLTALALGERFRFTEETWRDFRVTGTSHLVAVSGMHVALLGLAVFVCLRWLFVRLPTRLAAYDLEVAAAASVLATAGYAALTGFALPAQRSLTMIVVALAIVVSRREIAPLQSLGAALLAILVLDPFAPLSASFWLSFVAVAFLMLLAAPRVPAASVRLRLVALFELTRMQWGISFALLPLTALFFAEISVVGPAVNLLAIPLFNLVLVPLALLATLLTPLAPAGDALIFGAGLLASTTMLALHRLATFPWASLPLAPPGFCGRCSRLRRCALCDRGAAAAGAAARLARVAAVVLAIRLALTARSGASGNAGRRPRLGRSHRDPRAPPPVRRGSEISVRIRQRRADRTSGTRR